MTGTELVNAIKSHLGDMQSGYVGSQTVDEAVLDSLNSALRSVIKGTYPAELQDSCTIDVSTSTDTYAYPVVNDSGATIRIRSFYLARLKQDSETTARNLPLIPDMIKDGIWPYVDSNQSGRPQLISDYGKQFRLYPFPDDDYSIYLKVNVWPQTVTTANLSTALVLDDEWYEVIEAYGTYHMFVKLQQTQDAGIWFNTYRALKRELIGDKSIKPSMVLDATLTDIPTSISADWARDPFYNKETF